MSGMTSLFHSIFCSNSLMAYAQVAWGNSPGGLSRAIKVDIGPLTPAAGVAIAVAIAVAGADVADAVAVAITGPGVPVAVAVAVQAAEIEVTVATAVARTEVAVAIDITVQASTAAQKLHTSATNYLPTFIVP